MQLDIVSVKTQLGVYGYDVDDQKDYKLLVYALDKSKQRAMNFCNRDDIPERMVPEVISMAAGEFLYFKKTFLGLDDLGIHLDNPFRVSQVTEGDTSFSLSDSQKEEFDIDLYINTLRMGDRYVLEHFRKLDWGTR